eukprot:5856268-Prymnesium_polylepis.2
MTFGNGARRALCMATLAIPHRDHTTEHESGSALAFTSAAVKTCSHVSKYRLSGAHKTSTYDNHVHDHVDCRAVLLVSSELLVLVGRSGLGDASVVWVCRAEHGSCSMLPSVTVRGEGWRNGGVPGF